MLVRSTADVETVDGVTAEYAACAQRYFVSNRDANGWRVYAKRSPKWCVSAFGRNG